MSEYPAVGAVKLSKRTIDALSVERGDKVFWDRDQPGFGIRVHATGRKIYVAQARTPGGLPKRGVIGRYVEMTTEEARRKAAVIVDRIRRGENPVPPPPVAEPTVADLAARFMAAHVEVNCKPGTVEKLPEPAQALHSAGPGRSQAERGRPDSHVSALHYGLRDTPARANQSVGRVLEDVQAGGGVGHDAGAGRTRAGRCGATRSASCERFLSEDEYARLGRVLFEAEVGRPSAWPRRWRRCACCC